MTGITENDARAQRSTLGGRAFLLSASLFVCFQIVHGSVAMAGGNVMAEIVHGDLIIEGDDEDNDVRVEWISETGTVVFRGHNGTTVNGYETYTLYGEFRDLRIDLGDGTGLNDDSIVLWNVTTPRNVHAEFGDSRSFIGYYLGSIGGNLHVTKKGDGDHTSSIGAVDIGGNVKLRNGKGRSATNLSSNDILGNLDVDSTQDDVYFTSRVQGNFTFKSGDLNDTIAMGLGSVDGKTSLQLNGGDDGFHTESFDFYDKLEIDGGSGTDSYYFAPVTVQTEEVKLKRMEDIAYLEVYF